MCPGFSILLFLPTLIKNCSSDREKLLEFEAEGQKFAKFAKILRSLAQYVGTVKGHNKFGNRILFQLVAGGFSDIINENNYNLNGKNH